MDYLNDDELRRVRLYRTLMFAMHHHDPTDERGAGVYTALLVLLAMLESTDQRVMPLADELLDALGEARARRALRTGR